MKVNFADRLCERVRALGSRVCVGCDPEPDLLPAELKASGNVLAAVEQFGFRLIEATAPYAAAVKFQSAFYERLGSAGICILEKHLAYGRGAAIPVILDAKRGDVGHTSRAYAEAYLSAAAPMAADAVTVAPYLGRDTLEVFAEVATANGAGFFALVKTSNPGAGDLQDLVTEEGAPVYERTAALVAAVGEPLVGENGWSGAGAVVGATYPELVGRLRELMPRQIFLLPGVGAQGGDAALLGAAFDAEGLGAVVAASRSVAFAGREAPELAWEEAAAAAARELRDRVNAVALPT